MVKVTRRNVYKVRQSRKNKQIIIYPKRVRSRVAILLIGRIKGYTNVEEKLRKIQKRYNATIFCSLNKRDKSNYIQVFCNKFNIGDSQLYLEPTPPVPNYMTKYPFSLPLNVEAVYSCSYHKKKCFDLLEEYQKKQNIQFDCIIYYRADIDGEEDFVISEIENNTVYIPEGFDVSGINDQIAYGNYRIMKLYFSILDSIEEMCNWEGILYHPELLLKKHLDHKNITIKRFPYKYTLHPSRVAPLAEYDDFQ